jgi:hypothetical protein
MFETAAFPDDGIKGRQESHGVRRFCRSFVIQRPDIEKPIDCGVCQDLRIDELGDGDAQQTAAMQPLEGASGCLRITAPGIQLALASEMSFEFARMNPLISCGTLRHSMQGRMSSAPA